MRSPAFVAERFALLKHKEKKEKKRNASLIVNAITLVLGKFVDRFQTYFLR